MFRTPSQHRMMSKSILHNSIYVEEHMRTSSSCSFFFFFLFFSLDNDCTLFMENEQINPTITEQAASNEEAIRFSTL